MQISFIQSSLFTLLIAGFVETAIAYENTESDHAVFTPKDIHWMNGPDSLPKGAKIAVLEGDPSKAGPFTMRLKFPSNYRIPPHWHPVIEHITVISGNFYIGMGDKFDPKISKTLPTASFAYMMPEMRHFAFTKGEAVVQLYGVGPWGITYVDPKDDPRNLSN